MYVADQKAKEIRRETAIVLGRQRALYAKAGVDMSSESPLLVMENTAAEGNYRARLAEWAGLEENKMDKFYKDVAEHGGNAAMWSNSVSLGLGIGSTVAGGFAGAAGGGGAGGAALGATAGSSGGGWGDLLKKIK
jgi:hypothetical protein